LGIPEDEQDQLFERFFRSSSSTEAAIPGTGLGLTITKAIVERHGGTIEVESAPHAGTTVRVRLPLQTKQERGLPLREIATA
jgi:signal transduction histidine kinase